MLGNMSFLCACLVVAIHVKWVENDSVCRGFSYLFKQTYSNIAVPFFFIASGYFIAGHVDDAGWWKRETMKRVKSIVIPFLVFSLLVALLGAPMSIVADHLAGRPFGTNVVIFHMGMWPRILGFRLDAFPAYNPLWFLRSLFIYVVLSAGIVWLIRKFGLGFLIVLLAGAALLFYAPNPDLGGWSGFLHRGLSMSGLLYFSIGIYIRIRDLHVNNGMVAVISFGIGGGLIALNAFAVSSGTVINAPIHLIMLPALLYVTWYLVPTQALPSALVSSAFPIYLLHSIVLGYWGGFCRVIGFVGPVRCVLAWPIAIFGLILVARLIKRYVPSFYAIAFGGR